MTDSPPYLDAGLFAALAPADAAGLVARGEVTQAPASAVLVRQGERADRVYVVLSGSASVLMNGTEVGPRVGAGECIGELAVLDDAPRAATVTAMGAMTLLRFAAADFTAALDELPVVRRQVTRALTSRLRQVSIGWAQLAVDTDVLLESYFALQGSADQGDRHAAITAAAALLRRLAADAPAPSTPLDALTPAERKVADLVARGMSNAAVAAELFLSEHTVASHLKHIYVKLALSSRVALASAVLRARPFPA